MKKIIVTTTINPITEALEKFDAMSGWHLVVIGDKKTPVDFSLKNGTYIPPEQQSSLGFECIKNIPWNVIQRRNIGYLFALREGADVIATVDDDNIPYSNWGKKIPGSTMNLKAWKSPLIFDPLFPYQRFLTKPGMKFWHRGYPVQMLNDRERTSFHTDDIGEYHIDVVAELWDGDPDIDAVCRLAHGPFDVKFPENESLHFVVDNSGFSPYNTQNTIFTRKIAPCMCLPYDIGRMDDIWASYMTERVMREINSNVAYLGATVYQDRNIHDLSKDLEKEVIGYKHTIELLKKLNDIEITGKEPIDMYKQIVTSISDLKFISKEMTDFQLSWIDDVARII